MVGVARSRGVVENILPLSQFLLADKSFDSCKGMETKWWGRETFFFSKSGMTSSQ